MKGRLVAALAGVSTFAFAVAVAGDAVVVPFSASKPAGPLPGAWRVVGVPKARPAQVDLVEDTQVDRGGHPDLVEQLALLFDRDHGAHRTAAT